MDVGIQIELFTDRPTKKGKGEEFPGFPRSNRTDLLCGWMTHIRRTFEDRSPPHGLDSALDRSIFADTGAERAIFFRDPQEGTIKPQNLPDIWRSRTWSTAQIVAEP